MSAQPPSHVPDRIRLTGVRAHGYHGVLPDERRDGQEFLADVVLHLDTRPAASGDDLTRTVHYGELAQEVAGILAGDPADLLETVAERIAAAALEHEVVDAVEVRVHKPHAPIPVPFADVCVEVHRSRSHPPVVHRTPAAEPQGAPVLAPEAAPIAATAPPAAGSTDAATRRTQTLTQPQDRMDLAPDEPVEVVLAIGSNLGPSQETLRQALADLDAVPGVDLTAVSPLARTAPVGGPDQPDYLNAVLVARTTLSPRELLRACQEVEARHGRERHEHWGARTLDVDVITYGTLVAQADDLDLPHPRAHARAFVLQPWAQVQPDAVLPGLGGGPVAALARTAPDLSGIRWLALDWWRTEGAGRRAAQES